MQRIKNPDVAAVVTMLLALAAEITTQVATDTSLLARLPPCLGPILLVVAASIRLRLSQSIASPPSEPPKDNHHGKNQKDPEK